MYIEKWIQLLYFDDLCHVSPVSVVPVTAVDVVLHNKAQINIMSTW